MQITNIHHAKSHLSKLVDLAFDGEEVIICKAGKPMVKLTRYYQDIGDRSPGYWQGKTRIDDDFDEMSSSLHALFTGEKDESST